MPMPPSSTFHKIFNRKENSKNQLELHQEREHDTQKKSTTEKQLTHIAQMKLTSAEQRMNVP